MKKNFKNGIVRFTLILFASTVFLFGCATNRGFVTLDIPKAQPLNDEKGQQICITSVTDNRKFQDDPRDPSIPSLGFGGLANASEEDKKRAIARKRNSWGQALGDILLKEDQTVETVVYELISNSLKDLGYSVVNNENDTNPDSIKMDVSIDQFWAWFTPGFWAIKTEAEIETNIALVHNDKKEIIIIKAYAINKAQTANTGTWKNLFKKVFKDYEEKTKTKLEENLGG